MELPSYLEQHLKECLDKIDKPSEYEKAMLTLGYYACYEAMQGRAHVRKAEKYEKKYKCEKDDSGLCECERYTLAAHERAHPWLAKHKPKGGK